MRGTDSVRKKQTKKPNAYRLCLIALFTALTVICTQILIPIGAVPVSLATLAVFLCGAFLGVKDGLAAQGLYLLMGIVGLPVFSGFQGGIGKVLGPTGGYLVGYLAIAVITGITAQKTNKLPYISLSMAAGIAVCYAFGTVWYCATTSSELTSALAVCVLPFIPADAVKIIVASVIVKTVKPRLPSF